MGDELPTLLAGAGPFDVFSVDVSFASARSQLRALAFRLRPGAQGVVLVKPQFELPARRVRQGDVSDPGLRAEAVARVREKAESLGFRVVETIDSPVAGGSGTVEILAHLVFESRSARLPQPGERRRKEPSAVESSAADVGAPVSSPSARPARGAQRERARASITSCAPELLQAFAIALPGLEALVTREVAALPGVRDVRAVERPPSLVLHANLVLRAQLVSSCVWARSCASSAGRAAALPFERFLAADATVRASATHCRLHHTGALEENGGARARRRRAGRAHGAVVSSEAAQGLLVRGEDDRF